MGRYVIVISVFIITLSCRKAEDHNAIDSKVVATPVNDAVVSPEPDRWYDAIVADYIRNSEKELIRAHLKKGDNVSWILDNTEKTDSAYYFIFNIGQEVTDEDNTNPRFSSNGWIYIDSLSKKVYEYDLPNDRLVLWEK